MTVYYTCTCTCSTVPIGDFCTEYMYMTVYYNMYKYHFLVIFVETVNCKSIRDL